MLFILHWVAGEARFKRIKPDTLAKVTVNQLSGQSGEESQNAVNDKVDSHDVVQGFGHDQNQDSGNKGQERLESYHRMYPLIGASIVCVEVFAIESDTVQKSGAL